jgi:hypothetical protein
MSPWQGLGLAIGATLMDLKRATTLASVTVMTFMLAGGYFVKVKFIKDHYAHYSILFLSNEIFE